MAQAGSAHALKHTPFHDLHAALGARLVPFAGYEMPVQYPTGITAEHHAVRERCGMFDVSHMGEFIVRGPQAIAFVTHVTTNDVAALAPGQVHYSTILNDRGTIEDDCLVYRYADDHLMMVVNGSNRDKDLAHVLRYIESFDCTIEDRTEDVALLAVQGPEAADILQTLTETDLAPIRYYHFVEGRVAGIAATISRTGYTGEDGFELYFDPSLRSGRAPAIVWNALLETGRVTPAGLGCRDSLRLEMGMALYGNDIDDTTTPLEAGLGWLVKMKKGEFVGRGALERQKAEGLTRRLVGFTVPERAFPRHGYPVLVDGQPSGMVCSGTMSPSLGIGIGTCYVPVEPRAAGGAGRVGTGVSGEGRTAEAAGRSVEIEVRGRRIPVTVTPFPFYRHGSNLGPKKA